MGVTCGGHVAWSRQVASIRRSDIPPLIGRQPTGLMGPIFLICTPRMALAIFAKGLD